MEKPLTPCSKALRQNSRRVVNGSSRLLSPAGRKNSLPPTPAGSPRPRRPQRARSPLPSPLTGLVCLLLMLLAAAPLRAEDFRRFRVLIPAGWQVREPSPELLLIRSPDGDAVAEIICMALPDKRPAGEILEDYVRYFSGSEPQERKDGSHIFRFMRGDTHCTALFRHDKRSYLLLILSDPGNRYPECLDMVMNSLALREDAETTP